MDQKSSLERIPMPEKKPFVGNMLSVDKDNPLQSLMDLTRELGPIFRMDMMGKPMVIVSGADLVDELCDESRFDKAVRGALRRVRAIGGDGLFTGDTQEPNWSKAHNILLPTFSRQAMNNYMPMMLDVANQLVLKWERMNDDDEIDVVHDMTAVALDTIGICGFNYRFNSFYRQDYHPFIDALTHTLETCMMQRGLPFESQFLKNRLDRMKNDVEYMNNLVDDIIRERRKGGGDKAENDLLNYMLSGVDKVTGESLSDENIRYQINTFLIAGHETTSGLMSFTLYFLLNHPEVLEKAYEEVDRVLGRDISVEPTIKEVNQLTYISQILSESLRLWPTAPALSVYPYKDEVIGGKYKLKEKTFTTILSLMLHRDKSVWGDNAENFDPEHFSRDAIASRPINAYKPFGNGQRACIGRQFAMQEAVLVMGMILQRFELIDHTNYKLKIKESMSIKPDGFMMKVKLRPEIKRSKLVAGGAVTEEKQGNLSDAAKRPSHGTPALILYGSNLGTTEDFARELARDAENSGFETTLATLDEYAGKLPTEGAVIITCASYNGAPPDNAAEFVSWLEQPDGESLAGVNFAVYGCGHSDWASTFQATPRLIDEHMKRLGASSIRDRAEGDARDDIEDEFHKWSETLWQDVAHHLNLDVDLTDIRSTKPLFEVEFLSDKEENPLVVQTGSQHVKVSKNAELQNTELSKRSTRHIEIELPAGMEYRTGDHLCIVPRNDRDLVKRVEQRFGLGSKARIQLSSENSDNIHLPTGTPISVRYLLTELLELQAPASRKDVETLARYTECPKSKPALDKLASDDYRTKVFLKRASVVELLEQFPACELPFGVFIELMPMMAQRYYSISSSPLENKRKCSITVGVVDEPAISGHGQFKGVCSNFLSGCDSGSTVFASVRPTKAEFRLPEDPDTPVIMIGPGTGIAPFRGFLQERAKLIESGKKLGPAVLYFGCRHPDQDFLYREELEGYKADGVTDLHVAFSRQDKKKTYVQDLIREDRSQIWQMIENGAHIYVCGDGSRMEPDVRRALSTIYSEEKDVGAEAGNAWLEQMIADDRYVLDVWVSN
ncbi:MAG: cytochrome P450 [Rhizobiaceae bacterium]|nr:cytochrome P450 [Rhizobiaceae bacterium]